MVDTIAGGSVDYFLASVRKAEDRRRSWLTAIERKPA
jgi:hypothetical protein